MSTVRIALANIRVPTTPQELVVLATKAIAQASQQGALILCFPECFVPGYRWTTSAVVRPDGTLQCFQPYGQEGLLVAGLDLSEATGFLASRCRTSPF